MARKTIRRREATKMERAATPILRRSTTGKKRGSMIGIHAMKKTPIILSDDERGRHMHIVGRTGSGKSKLMEWMVRQDILAGHGVLLLDPHGTHEDSPYQSVLRWMADLHLDRQLYLIDLNERMWAPGLNYLSEPDMTNAWVADRARDGISKVFGGEQQETMPLLWSWLPTLLHALADAGYTLAEGRAFIDDSSFRAAVVSRVQDPEIRATWQAYEHDRKTQEIAAMALRNRMMPFSGEDLRPVVGQAKNTIDWKAVMDQGGVVLVNLSPKYVTAKAQQMLGVMILHQVLGAARRRKGLEKEFFAYCDEFQDYVSGDFARALEQLRKFRVSFVLAHQHLAQLVRAEQWILESVISQPGIRVVFDPGNRADAEVLARELFTGTSEVTGRRLKDQLWRTFFEPVLGSMDVESTTSGSSYGGSDSWSGDDYSYGSSESHTESVTRSTIPVTEHVERKEVAGRTYVSLDEEREKTTAWVMRQRDRHALLHLRGQRPMRMVTPNVKKPKASDQFLTFRSNRALQRSGRPRAEVEAEIEARRNSVSSSRTKPDKRKEPEIPRHEDLEEQE
jgi:hypothetical protein